MIVAVKSYLTARLVAAGIPANRIAQEAKENRAAPMEAGQSPIREFATEQPTALKMFMLMRLARGICL